MLLGFSVHLCILELRFRQVVSRHVARVSLKYINDNENKLKKQAKINTHMTNAEARWHNCSRFSAERARKVNYHVNIIF